MIGTLFTGLAAPSQAQGPCGPHGEIVKVLNGKYKENRRALGLINDKAVMEVYISAKGTWTLLVTDQAGITCILAAGEAWDEAPLFVEGTGI